ncbi:MAG: hypothetical protein ACI857_001192 [Arenicella sp.]|jgi:hypothetical protein
MPPSNTEKMELDRRKEVTVKSKIYCLGGLIIEKNIFTNLSHAGLELVHIPYEPPKNKESLKDYAFRHFNQAQLPENYQLLGVSFGGIIATEFAKIRKPQKLYLVSSISRFKQIPLKYRLIGYLWANQLIPKRFLTSTKALSRYLFGIKGKKNLERIKKFSSPKDLEFLRWALKIILNWKNSVSPHAIRIHGTKDKILPYEGNAEYPILNGSHFIISNRSDEIAEILSLNNE